MKDQKERGNQEYLLKQGGVLAKRIKEWDRRSVIRLRDLITEFDRIRRTHAEDAHNNDLIFLHLVDFTRLPKGTKDVHTGKFLWATDDKGNCLVGPDPQQAMSGHRETIALDIYPAGVETLIEEGTTGEK